MSIPNCPDTVLCCTDWVDDAANMLLNISTDLAALECFNQCEFELVTSMTGDLGVARGNFMAAYLDQMQQTLSASGVSSSGIQTKGQPTYRFDWVMILSVEGWPVIEKDGQFITTPDLDRIGSASKFMYALGEAFARSIYVRCVDGSILDERHGCQTAALTGFRRLVPGQDLFPGSIGWRANISYTSPFTKMPAV